MIFWPRARFEWRLRTRSVSLGECTRIVAVVNVGDGSSAGAGVSTASRAKVAVAAAVQAFDAGADIVELVVESARGYAALVTTEEEQGQLLPVLEGLMMARPKAVVAVAVRHAAAGRAAVRLGAEILNDVSSGDGLGWDDDLAKVVARTGCGLVLRHVCGRRREWVAEGSMSSDEVVPEVFAGLCERIMLAESADIAAEQIVADPGFGAGRRVAEEMALLAGLGRLRQLGRPLVVGTPVAAAAEGVEAGRARVVASHVAAILAGVHLLRVRDVAVAREAVSVADAVLEAGNRSRQRHELIL